MILLSGPPFLRRMTFPVMVFTMLFSVLIFPLWLSLIRSFRRASSSSFFAKSIIYPLIYPFFYCGECNVNIYNLLTVISPVVCASLFHYVYMNVAYSRLLWYHSQKKSPCRFHWSYKLTFYGVLRGIDYGS